MPLRHDTFRYDFSGPVAQHKMQRGQRACDQKSTSANPGVFPRTGKGRTTTTGI